LEKVAERFAGGGYGTFKRELADALIAVLSPIQKRFHLIREDAAGLSAHLKESAVRARERAAVTLRQVHEALGFVS
jgi:tryptophanyl-tRNA synthetase